MPDAHLVPFYDYSSKKGKFYKSNVEKVRELSKIHTFELFEHEWWERNKKLTT